MTAKVGESSPVPAEMALSEDEVTWEDSSRTKKMELTLVSCHCDGWIDQYPGSDPQVKKGSGWWRGSGKLTAK
jgi:hypothetical protein